MVTLVPISFKQGHMNKFNKHMNKRVGQWMEGGLFHIQMKWEIERAEKIPLEVDDTDYVADKTSTFAPLKLDMFRLLFGAYAVGVTSAFLAALFEFRKKWYFHQNIAD